MTYLDRCKAFFEAHGYIEFFDHRETGTWRRVTTPSWDEDVEYRVPRRSNIDANGFEIVKKGGEDD